MSTVLATAMVASVVTVATPSAVKAETVKMGQWTITQAGEVADNWGDWGAVSRFDSIKFADGAILNKGDMEGMAWVDNKAVGGVTSTTNTSNGFVADIISNGWQADYAPKPELSKNNPWSLLVESKDIKLQLGYNYIVSFDASCILAEGSEYDCKYANIVVVDSDTNVYAADTIKITPESKKFNFEVDVINQPNVTFQVFLGAFPIEKAPVEKSESNWKGVVNFSDITFTNNGPSEKVVKVEFNNNGKKTSTFVEKGATVEEPKAGTRKGYAFKGWYVGSSKFNFKKPVTKNVTITAKWEKVTKPATAKIASFKSKKAKQVTVTAKKVTGVKGYKVVIATDKKFKKGKKTITFNGSTKTIKKLKSGVKYFVKIKAFKVDSTGKKYESKNWSKVKSVYVK